MKRKREVIASDAMNTQIRETVQVETAKEFSELFARSLPSLEEAIGGLKEWLNCELQKRGWPPMGIKVKWGDDGKWQLSEPGDIFSEPHLSYANSERYIKQKAEPLSSDYFLAEVVDDIMHIERLGPDPAYREAAIFLRALSIGEHLRTLELRRNHLGEVTEAKATAAGRRRAADAVNREHAARREARMTEMERLVPNLGPDAAAKKLEAQGLGGWTAIKRQWNRRKIK